ncbi:hypothetical protein PMAC_001227 [Pneumocystis sp. 'macacae']|nr:hypothetical protein PMAC_001227 [Pneumocystis sp. 'macacae']
MKVFVLVGFLGIAYAFSEKFIHKRSASLNPSVNAPLILTTKEKIFTLILKEDVVNGQCQAKLQEYCKKLQDMNLLDKILSFHSEMGNFCKNINYEETCNNLKGNIEKYCQEFKEKLKSTIAGHPDPSKVCTMKNECILLENVCSDGFKKECNDLTSLCYQEKRDNLRTEFLLRAFSGNLKTEGDCEKVINEKCLMFIGESDELMKFCLTALNRCEDLMKLAKTKCKEIEKSTKDLQGFIDTCTNVEALKRTCILLLKGCYFHKSNCDDSFQNVCKILEKKCGEERKYIPPDLVLDPLEKEITLMEEIEYKEIFEDEIGKPGIKDTIDLIALISDDKLNTCESNIEKCYKFCSSVPQLKDLYDNSNKKMNQAKKKICTDLKSKLELRCRDLKSKLHSLSMSSTTDDDSTVLGWSEQSTELNERLCIDLESKCFYLQRPCGSINIEMSNACANLKSSCLKTRFFRKTYQQFQNVLKGKLRNLAVKSVLKTCINELLELCNGKVNIQNPIIVDFCLRPWDACHAFASDIERQSRRLKISLGWKRDFPNEENCKELQEKCETLGQDSRMNELPCLTLKERCNHLKNAKELGKILLKEKIENLGDLKTCIKKVTERCNSWSRKKRTGFALSCIQLNTTCQMITRDISFKCAILERNMDLKDSLNQVKNVNATIKELACDFWEPYCDVFMSNCKKLVQDNGKDGKCKELKENCKLYRELQDKEKAIMYELRGSLNEKNKCQSTFDKYCLNWDKTNNHTFKNFCNSAGTKASVPKNELCEKLIERVKERCTELSTELRDMAIELEKSVKAVKGLNEVAKKALGNAKLTLNKQETDINNAALILLYNANSANTNMRTKLKTNTSQKNPSGYLQQKKAEVDITDKEVEAFDATTEVLKVYTEVEAKCRNLLLECGFKEDCSEYGDSCKRIEEACNKLKSLEIKLPGKEAINQTTIEATVIIKTGPRGTQKTLIVGGECFSVRTTDKWVTNTPIYIQTSVITSTVRSSQCKPTKCGEEAGDVKPSKGLKMNGWDVMKGVILTMIILVIV